MCATIPLFSNHRYLSYKPGNNPTNAEATFVLSAKIFENHLNPVMLVFIGKQLSLTTLRSVSCDRVSVILNVISVLFWPN